MEFLRVSVILIAFFVLSACAGTPKHLHMLEDGGTIKMETADDSTYDYKVYIKNTVDFGWDGDDRTDREKYIALLMKDKCKSYQVLGETPFRTGTYAISKPAITWVIKIKCEKLIEQIPTMQK